MINDESIDNTVRIFMKKSYFSYFFTCQVQKVGKVGKVGKVRKNSIELLSKLFCCRVISVNCHALICIGKNDFNNMMPRVMNLVPLKE